MLTKAYLILYNLAMTLGWGYVLYLSWEMRNEPKNMWKHVEIPLKIFQSGAILEIVHAMTGLVKSSVFLTFFQVFSRVGVLWGVLHISPPSTLSLGVSLCMVAWDITEIIRYGYYFFNLIGLSQLLTWPRYTFFIVLYPLGITGELMCIYEALDFVHQNKFMSYSMPNAFNFTFHYYYALVVAMILYIPIFPQLYGHMWAQRKKILGGGGATKSKSTKAQ